MGEVHKPHAQNQRKDRKKIGVGGEWDETFDLSPLRDNVSASGLAILILFVCHPDFRIRTEMPLHGAYRRKSKDAGAYFILVEENQDPRCLHFAIADSSERPVQDS